MTMSVDLKTMHAKAAAVNATLRADDPRFNGEVFIQMEHGDGFHHWRGAFYEKHVDGNQKWVVAFTEHDGFHVYADDEVDMVTSNKNLILKIRKAVNRATL
jgi:hypothetical protein